MSIVLAHPQAVHAGTGINQQINYQARLLNAQGATVPDGTYNIQFKIYKNGDGTVAGDTSGAPAGTLLWTETWQNSNSQGITVKNGYFSVQLGAICALSGGSCQGNTSTGVDFNQSVLWLSVNIGGTATGASPTYDGEMLPMRQLAAAPYALNSNMLGGLTSSQFIQNVATTATAQSASFNIQGNSSTAEALISGGSSQTGDLLQFQIASGGIAAGIQQNGAIYTAPVGVGATIQTNARLFVQANAAASIGLVVRAAYAAGGTATGDIVDLQNNSSANVLTVGATGNFLSQASTNSTTAFQIQNATNAALLVGDTQNFLLGIGAAPTTAGNAATLQVTGTADVIGRVLQVGPTPYTAPITIGGPNSGYLVIDKSQFGSDASLLLRETGAAKAEIGLATNDDLHIKVAYGTAGSETYKDGIIVFGNTTSAGTPFDVEVVNSLGIGTATPANLLHIDGSSTSSRLGIKLENDGATSGSNDIQFSGFQNNWVLGNDLGFNGNTNFFLQDAVTNLNPIFVKNTTNNSSGQDYVGIGNNTSPAYPLDVTGVINTNTGYDIGGTSVCDTVGNTGCIAKSGSGYYIHNQTTLQTGANLDIQGTSGTVTATLEANGGNILNLQNSGGTTVSAFTSTGQLGIGTAAPSQALDVYNGNAQIDYGGLKITEVSSPGALTATASATAGVLNSSYAYVVTFVTANGQTNFGTASTTVSPANKQVNLTNIPTGTAGIVTGRKIYRTKAGFLTGPYYLLTTLNDNTTTTYTDNTADGSLGVIAPSINTSSGAGLLTLGSAVVLQSDTTSQNTLLGQNALTNNTSGVGNAAVGVGALNGNTTGNYNMAFGANALFGNTTGQNNIGIGINALQVNAGGSGNIAIGENAAAALVGGTTNTIIGYNTAASLASGNNNIIIGHDIAAPNNTLTSNYLNIGGVLTGNTSTGAAVFEAGTNSSTAFQIQNNGGTAIFNGDTSNNRILIGNGNTGYSTPVLLVLNSGTSATDPSGIAGAMYYNSSTGNFRCYQNGAWQNCIGGLSFSNVAPSTAITGSSAGTIVNWTTDTSSNSLGYPMLANDCQPGVTYQVTASGLFSNPTGVTNGGRFTLDLDGTTNTILSSPSGSGFTPGVTGLTNAPWQFTAQIICDTTGSGGTIEVQGSYLVENNATTTSAIGSLMFNASALTFDTTSAHTLYLGFRWNAGSNSASTISMRQYIVQRLGN